ncbi:ankyrin repeat-containing protein BDA1-like [Impatiens glandulifera]|uniref:ankyrin repeat-containing protein BDA1-like n=1 Tax=Impatiens glandulifera TaxID=253017 RepID=UPI001FB08CEB|nr:ankyrin repeat-containing protein BDA1-like [Impatiens glandulifera]
MDTRNKKKRSVVKNVIKRAEQKIALPVVINAPPLDEEEEEDAEELNRQKRRATAGSPSTLSFRPSNAPPPPPSKPMEIEQGREQRLYEAAEESKDYMKLQRKLEFVKSILALKPELAKELDSPSLTFLHLASAKGYIEIVKSLLQVNKNMCFVLDQNGMNPLHLSATKGRVNVLRKLVEAEPEAARVKLDGGDTILHICVENNKMEALEMLVQRVGDKEFLNSFDAHGNTILHLAVANKQLEIVRFLVGNTNTEVTSQNSMGLTPIDILSHSRRHVNDLGIFESLQSRRAENNQVIAPHNSRLRIRSTNLGRKDMKPRKPSDLMLSKKQIKREWVERKRTL